jgi:hypothetical protein
MSTIRPPARAEASGRRRARRGSLERPVNGRLYRGAFLLLGLPLVVLAFSVTRPGVLAAPQLPPTFDGAGARALAVEFARAYPDRAPGTSGALGAAQWFRDQMRPFGLPVTADSWQQRVPGLGRVRLQNLWAVVAGKSTDALVVMAHRDDTGAGPGANDDGSGTAALVELARGYAQTDGGSTRQSVQPEHTVVFLSTDAGAFGGLGAERFAARLPFHVTAVVNLDAIAGPGIPGIVITGDTARSPAGVLVETAARRLLEQTGDRARRASLGTQLLDLAFPFTLYEQGPLVSHGVPAVTLTTAGSRPPDDFGDRPGRLDGRHLTAVGRTAEQLLGSLDQEVALPQATTSFVWAGDRVVRGWAIELLLFGLALPYLVAVTDLFARCRRRGVALAPAIRSLRSRLGLWLFAGGAFIVFRVFGAWPRAPSRPLSPGAPVAGTWPVAALAGLAVLLVLAWTIGRQRLVPRREVTAAESFAGETVALLGLGVTALLVVATNAFALIFLLPMLHAWVWLPQLPRSARAGRAAVFAFGLVGPLLIPLSLALRVGLGLDAPWYLVALVSVGYVPFVAVVPALLAGACAAQLAACAVGRYAPYPAGRERPARGPFRSLVRAVVLTRRARRRATTGERRERRRAIGG